MNQRLGIVGTSAAPCLVVAGPDDPNFGGYLSMGGSLVMGWRGKSIGRLWGSAFPWAAAHELGPQAVGSSPAMAASWTGPSGPSLLSESRLVPDRAMVVSDVLIVTPRRSPRRSGA